MNTRHNSLWFRVKVAYWATERAYDRHSDLLHILFGAVLIVAGLAWAAMKWMQT